MTLEQMLKDAGRKRQQSVVPPPSIIEKLDAAARRENLSRAGMLRVFVLKGIAEYEACCGDLTKLRNYSST